MTTDQREQQKGCRWTTSAKTGLKFGAPFLMIGLLTACSSVPDAVNPVEWYRSTVDMLSSDDDPEQVSAQAEQSESVPGESDDFPDLNSVPGKPELSADNIGQGLIADPNKPEYASSISRQTNEGTDETQAELQPAPPALPVIPVEVVPVEAAMVPVAPAIPAVPAVPELAVQAQSATQTAYLPSTSSQLVIEAGILPSGETYDEYRARLMSGLGQQAIPATTVSTNAQDTPSITTPAMSGETLIISSMGVSNYGQYSEVKLATRQNDTGFMQIAMENGRLLLSPNATRIATVHFTNGSSRLNAQDQLVLRKVIALQRQNGGIIQIIGHASSRTRAMDPIRHKMVNYEVSVSRADAIANAMVRLGADKNSIMIGAVSDSQPLYYEVMPTGEAGNRRAEIYIGS